MTKKVARQADVAREAGVSQSTVSQVLGGGGDLTRISPETQRRVISAARQLRYRPSAQQRRAVERRQAPLLLGVHTFEPIFPTSARDYYFAFLQGIEEQSGVEGCNLVLFTAARDEGGVRRIYRDDVNGLGQAAGSILLGHHAHMDDLARLAADGHPFVYVGRREVPGADIAYVGGDYRSTTGRILDDLVAMGHRTFAYLGEAVRHEPQADRWAGFSTALDRFGLPVPRPLYVAPDQLAAQWLDDALAAGTTAILVESVSLLVVLHAIAQLRNLSVPEDFSVVLLVDHTPGEAGPGPWASMRIPRHAMGSRAVRLLTTLLTDPAGDYDRQILLPCTYALDATVSPPA
ncbi:LacI family DNA-binding transcriptional regulator [Actinacidiphila bryophytorum]|jgi:DNA-binding LacI/PurR family transcriptional regulator|uniref:LacI family DNA-binding transcriptional regulator n=1 Tax=Actinacidiphila bryophytorum TaxID=1436133 RepID=UPI002176E519|nr:LacI family DNA-binding transcriptional regulator [Actinacidiphila bryophytorum]UWE10519.1 LacI family transcriptional regulator [Actinacidiphila bryophytorum]